MTRQAQRKSNTTSMLDVRREGNVTTVFPRDEWTIAHIADIANAVHQSQTLPDGPVVVDGSELTRLDTVGAFTLLRFLGSTVEPGDCPTRQMTLRNCAEEHKSVFSLIQPDCKPEGMRGTRRRALGRIGHFVCDELRDIGQLLRFIGEAAVESGRTILQPKLFRGNETFTQIEQCFVNAVPVTVLVMALIGVVIAYLFGQQIEPYGANLLVADAVSLAICREMSPVIVAIIVAGRSGSAFTAQLGAMKLNEEIDAIITLGLSATRVLILPRLFALLLAMPLLVFLGDVIGILGGAVIAEYRLGVTTPTFFARLQNILELRHVFVGLVKAPVFAAFIAIIGCKMGITTASDAKSIGESTTSTVVQSIVSVILLNAAFAVAFAELKI